MWGSASNFSFFGFVRTKGDELGGDEVRANELGDQSILFRTSSVYYVVHCFLDSLTITIYLH